MVVDVNDPDALAVYCLLAALHGVQDSQLPMPTDKFYAQHILPAKPEGVPVPPPPPPARARAQMPDPYSDLQCSCAKTFWQDPGFVLWIAA